jgi:hypothetical protein
MILTIQRLAHSRISRSTTRKQTKMMSNAESQSETQGLGERPPTNGIVLAHAANVSQEEPATL